MTKAQATVDINNYYTDEANFFSLKEAASKLLNSPEQQFEEIKKEKWFNRVFDLVTFSQKGGKRTAEHITTLSQAQQILMEILTILSESDNKIADLAMENMENIKRLVLNDNYLMKRLIQLENNALGIKKSTDAQSLSQKNRSILSGCLYQMEKLYSGNLSYQQKNYADTLLGYINNSGDTVENLEYALNTAEEAARKTILTCCMEFIFLNNCVMEVPDDLKDFMDGFNMGNKTIEEIKKHIEATYNLRNIDGFISKYDFPDWAENNNYFDIDLDEENTSDFLESEVLAQEMTDYYISNILQVNAGEVKTFSYNKIHISSYINCEGTLEFHNCIVHYNKLNASDEITLSNKASLLFTDCIIICDGYDETFFIKSNEDVQIVFESCTFENCSNFIKSYCSAKFIMNNCHITNCDSNFLEIINPSICEMTNCFITKSNIADFNLNKDHYDIRIRGTENVPCKFSNNTIEETPEYKTIKKAQERSAFFIEASRVVISNCSFVGVIDCICSAYEVRDCQFKDCENIISTSSNYNNSEKSLIDNCIFEHCTNILTMNNNSHIKYCKFRKCYNNLISTNSFYGNNSIIFCEFIDIDYMITPPTSYFSLNAGGWACISFQSSKEKGFRTNKIEKCIFDRIRVNNGFLIQAKGFGDKPSKTVISVNDCNFINCSTKRASGSLIKNNLRYENLLKKELDFIAIDVFSCKGLDKVIVEGSKETNSIVTASTINAAKNSLSEDKAQNIAREQFKLIQSEKNLLKGTAKDLDWPTIKNLIHSNMTDKEYYKWIDSLKVQVIKDTIRIVAPYQDTATYIKQNYCNIIETSIAKYLKAEITVSYGYISKSNSNN